MATQRTFRHSAAFGKRIEYWIIGRMLKEGIGVYVPLVDDHAVDAIIKRQDGSTAHTYHEEAENSARVRLISARKATKNETKQYQRK